VVHAEDFYDALAPRYDLLFGDWWAAARWHGQVVAGILGSRGVRPPARVLDCTCGIGTQALPLAEQGYRMTGTDVSRRAVQRAHREAASRGLPVVLVRADVRDVREAVSGSFDAAVSCDNALPHLLTRDDLERAAGSIRACLRDGGIFVATVRDYDALRRTQPTGVPITLHGTPGWRHGSGQSWQWSEDGDLVDITLFTFREGVDGGWQVSAVETRYRALGRDELTEVLRMSGFGSVEWLAPEVSGYHQPAVVAVAETGGAG